MWPNEGQSLLRVVGGRLSSASFKPAGRRDEKGDEKSGGRVYRVYGFMGGGMMENHGGLK